MLGLQGEAKRRWPERYDYSLKELEEEDEVSDTLIDLCAYCVLWIRQMTSLRFLEGMYPARHRLIGLFVLQCCKYATRHWEAVEVEEVKEGEPSSIVSDSSLSETPPSHD